MTEALALDAGPLEPLGHAPEVPESPVSRQLEGFSAGKAARVQALHVVSQLFVLCVFLLGPPYISSLRQQFVSPELPYSKRFTFDLQDLHLFQAFVALDLVLFKSPDAPAPPCNVSVYFFASANTHSAASAPIIVPLRTLALAFPGGADESRHLRLFETTVVDFRDMHAWVALKYAAGSHAFLTGGRFEWFFADPCHSIVQLCLRFQLFVLALFMLARLLAADVGLRRAHIAMRLMFGLDALLVVASNPLYVLTFFTRSHALPLLDSLLGLFLRVAAQFTALALLMMNGLTHGDVTFAWVAVRFVPFALVFVVFGSALVAYHALVDADPLAPTSAVSGIYALARYGAMAIYALAYLRAVRKFKQEVAGERRAVVPLGIVLFAVLLMWDVISSRSQYAELKFANQIFTLLAVGAYVVFFNFVNWPVNREGNFRREPKEGLTGTLDLSDG
jgi:hypothetical protein